MLTKKLPGYAEALEELKTENTKEPEKEPDTTELPPVLTILILPKLAVLLAIDTPESCSTPLVPT